MAKFNVTLSGGHVEVTLPDGTKLSGSVEKVSKLLSNLGYSPSAILNTNDYYLSSTHGYMAVAAMATPHIRNAIIKRYSEWVEDLRLANNAQLLKLLENGPENLLGLIAELQRRVNRGE